MALRLIFIKQGENPNIVKCELEKGNGQWMFESDFYADSKRDVAIVTPYGKEEIQLKIHAKNCTAVSLNRQIQSFSRKWNIFTSLKYINGIFEGVGSVLSFLPIIVTLFFFLSILEDSGYMARVAFVMDKLLRKVGLSGRSIVPMLIGFGCTVPRRDGEPYPAK